jgi:hypothetical protein
MLALAIHPAASPLFAEIPSNRHARLRADERGRKRGIRMSKSNEPRMICGSIVMFLHFGQSGLQNALMMQSPTSGGSTILSVTGRCRFRR